MTLAEGPSEC